jgi:hypothetical protein
MTSAHPYPTEAWANLTLKQTQALVKQWIEESHNLVGKPFYTGEFNVHNVGRSLWWRGIFSVMEQYGGDGSGFWWYQDRAIDGKFGVAEGAPELAVLRAHSAAVAAKNGPAGPTPTSDPNVTPTRTPAATGTPQRSPASHY